MESVPMLHTGHTPPLLGLPEGAGSSQAGPRLQRLAGSAVAILLIIAMTVQLNRWMQQEGELVRYRAIMRELALTLHAMPSRARVVGDTILLRVDAPRGLFQFSTLRTTPRYYETVERTIWLPEGLQVIESPAALTVLPTGPLSAASILVAAPAHDRLFRLLTTTQGAVQLHEEPTL
jgi:hypothetical protein